MQNDTDEKYIRAKKRLNDVKEFYSHLVTYIAVNIFLFIINFKFTYGDWWFLFPLIIWGIFVLIDFFETFILGNKIFGKNWEEKKIRKYMEEE